MITFPRLHSNFSAQVKRLVQRTRKLVPAAKSAVGTRGDLIRDISNAFYVKVRDNLLTRKYPKNPAPLNSYYADWKLRNYGFYDSWFLEGDLFKNIKLFEIAEGRAVGVPAGIKAGGKSWFFERGEQARGYNPREITYYGYLLENGSPGGKMKARPVFGPTLKDFVNDDLEKLNHKYTDKIFSRWEIR